MTEWLPVILKAAGGLGVLAFLLTPMGLAVPGILAAAAGAVAARVASPAIRVLLLSVAVVAVLGLTYRVGRLAERGNTLAAITRATAAEELARFNEASALALGHQLRVNADAYDADRAQARTDADRIALAREAARIAADAATACQPGVPGEVHRALRGDAATGEDAPLPASMRSAMDALRKGRRK